MPREDPNNAVFDEIDESLRRAYEELLNEGLPERFLILIQRLKDGEKIQNDSGVSS